MLSRRLAEAGHYPAIDIEASISRAMTDLIPHAQYRKVQRFKQLLSAYQRNRDLVSVGAYVKGSDAMLDQAIDKYPSRRRSSIRRSTSAAATKTPFAPCPGFSRILKTKPEVR